MGYGFAGEVFHAPFIAAVPELAVAAIVVRSPERQAVARQHHPAAAVLGRVEEVWERARDFDLVVIATPNRAHVSQAWAALDAGLPVVVDKPLAATAQEARSLADHADACGLMLTVYQNRRWDGDFLTVQRLIGDGALGSVVRFESRFEGWRPQVGSGWRERPDADEGGGLLLDLGSHLVDQACVLFGPVSSVYAELDRRRPGAQVDDDSFVALTHASGVRSHLWMGFLAGQPGPRVRVLGDRATYVKHGRDVQEAALRAGIRPDHPHWGAEPAESWGMLGAGDDAEPCPTEPGDYGRFYRGVAHALRSGGAAPVDVRDVVAGLEILDAARRSSEERQVVHLPLD